jgi:hypothetical protein
MVMRRSGNSLAATATVFYHTRNIRTWGLISMTKEKSLAFTFLVLDVVVLVDNSVLACDPSKWQEAWRDTGALISVLQVLKAEWVPHLTAALGAAVAISRAVDALLQPPATPGKPTERPPKA